MNNLSINAVNPSFGAKFLNNNAFKEVLSHAESTGKLQALDSALHNLDMANYGDIILIHGKNGEQVFSSFKMGPRTSYNFANGLTDPFEISLNGILELGKLGDKFKKLAGGHITSKAKAEDIVKKYTV